MALKTIPKDIFGYDDLRLLIDAVDMPCISIYLPARKEMRKSAARFENAIKIARRDLEASGEPKEYIKKLLDPVTALGAEPLFWKHQNLGLAIFRNNFLFRHYRLPVDFKERTVVGKKFHLKPLFPFLSECGIFFILCLSKNSINLYQGSRDTLIKVTDIDIPTKISDILSNTDYEKQLQLHGGGRRKELFHGHGGLSDANKNLLRRFFLQIDRGLHAFLELKKAPLLLAGVDYYCTSYRQNGSYKNILQENLEGNCENKPLDLLHGEAFKKVRPFFKISQEKAANRYRELASSGRTSKKIEEIVVKAFDGKIDTLFAAQNEERWGSFDSQRKELLIHEEKQPGDEDLLNEIVIQTFSHRGAIYITPNKYMPDNFDVAAIFRI